MATYMHPLVLVNELKAIGAELCELLCDPAVMVKLSKKTRQQIRKLALRYEAIAYEPLPPSVALLGAF